MPARILNAKFLIDKFDNRNNQDQLFYQSLHSTQDLFGEEI